MAWATSDRQTRLPNNWPAIRKTILRRDNHRCQINGERCTIRATEVDHINPNDDHTPGNLRAVCATCHATKSALEGVAGRMAIAARSRRKAEPHPGMI